jgi:hypothetical protein
MFDSKNPIRLILILVAFLLILPPVTNGSDFRAGKNLIITKDQVINDDLYFAGNSITVDGTINGDLIAAGADIRISGTINGGLIAAAGNIIVNGKVTDDIRVAGGTVEIGGSVGDNALMFAGNLISGKDASIGRDLTIGVGNAIIDGTVKGNINGGGGNVELTGTTKGNVTLDLDNDFKLSPGAKIEGNLEYTSPKQAEIAGIVNGKTMYKEKPVKEKSAESNITGEILGYFWLLLIGILCFTLVPSVSQKISDNISVNPLKNILWGILLLIATPILAIILLITVIGIPLSLILVAVYIVEIYISRIFVGYWIGQYILKKLSWKSGYKVLVLALGLLVVFIGINMPILGTFVHFVIIILGLGALVLTEYEIYRSLKEQKHI